MKWGKTRKGNWVQGYYYKEDNQEYIIVQEKDIYTNLITKNYVKVVEVRDTL